MTPDGSPGLPDDLLQKSRLVNYHDQALKCYKSLDAHPEIGRRRIIRKMPYVVVTGTNCAKLAPQRPIVKSIQRGIDLRTQVEPQIL